MGRVHGEITIMRRTEYVKGKPYNEYKDILDEDFHSICGYCGKNKFELYKKFQIDHFIPKKKYPEYLNNYENLVLSCAECNRNKSQKWPTKNPNIPHDDKEGFVDPATAEFDEHIIREDDGNIVGLTEVGKYICRQLKIDIRPIRQVWQLEKLSHLLLQKKKELDDIINRTPEKMMEQIELREEIDNLRKYLVYEGNE